EGRACRGRDVAVRQAAGQGEGGVPVGDGVSFEVGEDRAGRHELLVAVIGLAGGAAGDDHPVVDGAGQPRDPCADGGVAVAGEGAGADGGAVAVVAGGGRVLEGDGQGVGGGRGRSGVDRGVEGDAGQPRQYPGGGQGGEGGDQGLLRREAGGV